MAAYTATVHHSTGYTPNYLMMLREVKSPVGRMYSTLPTTDKETTYDEYCVALEKRKRYAFQLVRQHLGTAAERLMKSYDLHVKPQKFEKSQLVLYYNPRRAMNKHNKWQRKDTSHLIIKELPPVNYLLQKTRRSRPFIAHVDKLKQWDTENPPKSWLDVSPNIGDDYPQRLQHIVATC